MMSPLTDKVALVTGAGRGIGRAVALMLAKAGCRVSLSARSLDQLELVAEEIRAMGGKALAVVADLTRDDDIDRIVEQTVQRWSSVDILINNAGWGKRSPVARGNPDEWDQTFKVNLRAPMRLGRMVLPAMIEKQSGAVINIGSISGKSGEAEASAYAASKFGLIGFTQSLYEEVREHGIKVSAILPGFVNTSMIPPVKQLDRSKMIQPEDVAQAVMFVLLSPSTSCPVEITIRPQRTPYRR